MIGNDIVDLNLSKIQINWQRKGYLDKIFTKNEQKFIFESKNQDQMVWTLWSCKEACYKIFNRKTNIRVFNPLQFECYNLKTINEHLFGEVNFDHQIYFTKTEINSNYIYSIATTNFKLLNKINNRFYDDYNCKPTIIKNKHNQPFLIQNNIISPISVSQHGAYFVYCN